MEVSQDTVSQDTHGATKESAVADRNCRERHWQVKFPPPVE